MLDFYLCTACAKKNGATWPKDHVATHFTGRCYLCEQKKEICAASDWKWQNEHENHALEKHREL